MIKGTIHKNGDVDGTCKQAFNVTVTELWRSSASNNLYDELVSNNTA